MKTIRIKNNNLPWVDAEMRRLFQERDRLHSFATEFPKSDPIWERYRECRNFCKSKLRRKMFEFCSDKTTSYFESAKKYWAFYKSVVKTKKSAGAHLITNIINAIGNVILRTMVFEYFNNSRYFKSYKHLFRKNRNLYHGLN